VNTFFVALGSALGGVCRWQLGIMLQRRYGAAAVAGGGIPFPVGTLLVNVSGSFIAGALVVLLSRRGSDATLSGLLLVVGFCGGYTTLSTFSVDTVTLIEQGAPGLAAVNALTTTTLAIVAALAGMLLARALLARTGA